MNVLKIILFSSYLFAFAQVSAQEYDVTSITASDGLIQEYIMSMCQDKRGFIWFGSFYGLYRYDGKNIKPYLPNHAGKWTLKSNLIVHITEDHQGLLWISTEDGVFIMDPLSEKIVPLHQICPQYSVGFGKKVYTIEDGTTWIYQMKNETVELFRVQLHPDFKNKLRQGIFDLPKAQLELLPIPTDLKAPLKLFFRATPNILLMESPTGAVYEVIIDQKKVQLSNLSKFCKNDFTGKVYLMSAEPNRGYCTQIKQAASTIKTIEQLSPFITTLDSQQLILPFYAKSPNKIDQNTPPTHLKTPIFMLDQPMSAANLVDRQGNIWIGTVGYGVRKVSIPNTPFRQFLSGKNIYNFAILPDQKIWLGCFENKWILNRTNGALETAPWVRTSNPSKNVVALLPSKKEERYYLVESDEKQKKLELLKYHLPSQTLSKTDVSFTNFGVTPPVLTEDENGNVWIANSGGEIINWNPRTNLLRKWILQDLFPSDKLEKILPRNIVQDKFQRIWIATNYGLIRISQKAENPHFEAWHNYSDKGILFKNNGIFCVYPDPVDQNLIWLGTLGNGLASLNIASSKVVYHSDLTYPGLIILGMTPDSDNNLWLSTSSGISCFNTKLNDFLTLDLPKTISKTSFNANPYMFSEDGTILFGSSDGLFEFKNHQLITSNLHPKVYVSDLKINGQLVSTDSSSYPLTFSNESAPILKLRYFENSFSLALHAPEAKNPATSQYRYRINQLSPNWIGMGKENTLSIVGLPPGRYLLELQIVTSGYSESKVPITEIEIIVSPPWHQTWYAYLCYTALGFAFLFGLYAYDRKRLSLQHESELTRREMNRLSSLDQIKSRFYAYIAHEFKTPLTIIMGLTEDLKQGNIVPNPVEFAEPILQESNHMLRLIDEIIDVSKLEDGTLKLNYETGDILHFLKTIVDAYQIIFESRRITFEFISDEQELHCEFDPKRLRYLLNNLIMNAFYYTPAGGRVKLSAHSTPSRQIQLVLSDSGKGIKKEKIPFIFEKYFRAEDGNQNTDHHGLGLSFVYELILLMEGTIRVESELNKGTTFLIELPIKLNTTVEPSIPTKSPKSYSYPLNKSPLPVEKAPDDAPLVLIVEDNPSIHKYLNACLAPSFQLRFATDGQMGLELAISEIPDLILTDVMLPILDGLEMTHQLKQNQLTSHIPIVILSAKSVLQDRLDGHLIGANSYLTKPFHSEELLLVLKNLFQLQQSWKKRYTPSGQLQFTLNSIAPSNELPPEAIRPTDEFMLSIYKVFEENYAAEAFDVIQLCKQLHVSKTQLYRKLSSVSDQTAMELLKEFRLQKAVTLLQNRPDLTVKEVAYLTGFKDRSHFSHLFTKKYGKAPSELRKKE